MTITSEIQRIKTNIANAYTACDNKGATIPATQNSANLATTINSIPSGITPTGTLSITANGVYDVTNYASANVSVSGGGEITLYAWQQAEGRRPMFFYSKSPTVSIGDIVICDFLYDSYGLPLPTGTVTNVGGDVTIQVPAEGITSRDDYYRAPSYDRTF